MRLWWSDLCLGGVCSGMIFFVDVPNSLPAKHNAI